MKWEHQSDDNEITTLRVTKGLRRKIGFLINGNETFDTGLEKIINEHIAKI